MRRKPKLVCEQNKNELIEYGAELIDSGIQYYPDWSAAMLREFGDSIKQNLDSIFPASQHFQEHGQHRSSYEGNPAEQTDQLKSASQSEKHESQSSTAAEWRPSFSEYILAIPCLMFALAGVGAIAVLGISVSKGEFQRSMGLPAVTLGGVSGIPYSLILVYIYHRQIRVVEGLLTGAIVGALITSPVLALTGAPLSALIFISVLASVFCAAISGTSATVLKTLQKRSINRRPGFGQFAARPSRLLLIHERM